MSSTLDRSVECIKNIVDFLQCRICDKVNGSRMRYPCGHTACDSCVLEVTSCLTCLTPPDLHSHTVVLDEPNTLRAKNALALKKVFEDTFQIDIYKKHRLSEQLKIEEELFPTPIKVSRTYYNKHKSLKSPTKNKENINISEEQVTSVIEMSTNKNSYVQQWLDRTETRHRKPFSDIDVNKSMTLRNTPSKQRADLILDKTYETSGFQVQRTPVNKRTHFKTSLSLANSQSKLNKHLKPVKKQGAAEMNASKFRKDLDIPEKHLHNKINDKDESGIVMDEDIISVNDSQSVVDKDREAWLAVLRAEAEDSKLSEPSLRTRVECADYIRVTDSAENTPNQQEQKNPSTSSIPFIKQSFLSESCQFCKDDTVCNNNQTAGQLNVSITIENKSFTATVTVSDNRKATGSNIKQSAYVQTDIQALLGDQSIATQSHVVDVSKEYVEESQDLFTTEHSASGPQDENVTTNVAFEHFESPQSKITIRIPDSDSDEDLNQSSVIEVTADVHRTSDPLDYGVLIDLDEKKLGLKTKPRKRAKTPASSDSSEKENQDPNKSKRRKLEKKSTKKQKIKRITI